MCCAAVESERLDDDAFIRGLRTYVGLDADDATRLRAIGPTLEPSFPGVVDAFYSAIEADPQALAVFANREQIVRQKRSLTTWLRELFGGVYDGDYFRHRAAIGRVHVRINLNQRFMFASMNVVRRGLHAAFRAVPSKPVPAELGHAALDRILDLELAVMLETYREAYDARLRTHERLATIGQLAATIGHELRNPLGVIESSLHLLKRRGADEDPRAAKHLERIQTQVSLSNAIIGDLLALARDRAPERAPTDIRAVIREAVAELPLLGARLELELPSDLPLVSVDAGQMRQMVSNLVTNAFQSVGATGRTGRVSVRASVREAELVLEVEDEGAGFDAAVQARLFEALFTTKPRGVGLGLALCKRIADKHGGTITAARRSEGGALFTVCIPDAVGTGGAGA